MILNEDSTKVRYDVIAKLYANGSLDIPHWKLENEICKRALGDCTGYRVLDLAGSTGDHARSCIEAGASRVDVVDPNAKMMEIGADIERRASRDNMIHWHKACVFSPLEASLPKLPHAGYDLVLAFWPWDQAGTFQEYVGVWRNAAAYLKSGGRLVGCRVVNPWARALQAGTYGMKTELIQQTEEKAVKVVVTIGTDSLFTFEAIATEASLRGDTFVPNRLGIVELENVSPEETETVKEDPDYWKDFLEDPYFVVFTARKKSLS